MLEIKIQYVKRLVCMVVRKITTAFAASKNHEK